MALLPIKQASKWASNYLKRNISASNISYLIQYGKVKRHIKDNISLVKSSDLKKYYDSFWNEKEKRWKRKLGADLNWELSFAHLREKERTKHVHRLHPYKGKFIPQLVEYFLDSHKNKLKNKAYFKKGDIVLDPFLGSGTTIIQANELGIHGIGIDISLFNTLISECKIQEYNINKVEEAIKYLLSLVDKVSKDNKMQLFEKNLLEKMADFNNKFFPSPKFRFKVHQRKINEDKWAKKKEKEFLPIFNRLVKRYNIKINHNRSNTFLDTWFVNNVRKEVDSIYNYIKRKRNTPLKNLLKIILSRTTRSCRATKHYNLATLKKPQFKTYYCYKHKKICKPIFSTRKMFKRYAKDTLKRIKKFNDVRTNAGYCIIDGDSRNVDILKEAKKRKNGFYNLLKKRKIRGIFSSPPYVGQIDYHRQHAYAYDLFGFKPKEHLEIGPLYKGKGLKAQQSYIEGISNVLNNCKKYLVKNTDIFLVANDKYNLYPKIAQRSNLKIVNQFKRPVLNRTERDRNPYSETIFHLKSI